MGSEQPGNLPNHSWMAHMLSWFVKSNLYVSCCAASLAYVTYSSTLGLDVRSTWPPPPAVWLLFFATLFVYNLDRLSPAAIEDRNDPEYAQDTTNLQDREAPQTRRLMGAMLALSIPGMACAALSLPVELILLLVPLAGIAIGYALPLIPYRGEWIRLKQVPGIKILLISLVWSIATVTLPGWGSGADPLSPMLVGETIARALFIFGITLPFDVRDMARDARAKITTIPILIGITRTRLLAMASIALMFCCELAMHIFLSPAPTAARLVPVAWSVVVTLGLLSKLHAERGEGYYAVYMEGTMGVYAASVVGWALLTTP